MATSLASPPLIASNPQLFTIKKAALILGVQYRQLLDGVNQNAIPHYRLQKSRRLVRLDEVLAVMKHTSEGEV